MSLSLQAIQLGMRVKCDLHRNPFNQGGKKATLNYVIVESEECHWAWMMVDCND